METETEPLVEAIKAGDVERVRAILKEHPALAAAKKNDTSFVLLCLYAGKPEVAEELVAAGAPLGMFEACALGNVELVEKLLGADAKRTTVRAPDGHTPLGLACFFGHSAVAMLLLERGADVNAAAENNMKVAPLHSAVARRNRNITELLLSRGADVNARQQNGYTPLHGAAAAGDREICELLLLHGADKAAKAEDGKTAADLARERKQDTVLDLL
jgi:uncharacterized protein